MISQECLCFAPQGLDSRSYLGYGSLNDTPGDGAIRLNLPVTVLRRHPAHTD